MQFRYKWAQSELIQVGSCRHPSQSAKPRHESVQLTPDMPRLRHQSGALTCLHSAAIMLIFPQELDAWRQCLTGSRRPWHEFSAERVGSQTTPMSRKVEKKRNNNMMLPPTAEKKKKKNDNEEQSKLWLQEMCHFSVTLHESLLTFGIFLDSRWVMLPWTPLWKY